MSYRVQYGVQPHHGIPGVKKRGRLLLFTALWFLLFLGVTVHFWPEGREVLQALVLPDGQILGDLELLVESVQEGTPFSQAVQAFCEAVFERAGVQ